LLLLITGGLFYYFSSNSKKIDYNTEVKPIFNKKCIACHGGVKAKANFSLLFREDAMKPAKSGKYPIVPGKPGESEMIRRITEKDEDERMPYKHDPLTKEEISILKKWIKQGAEWGEHWAYVPVQKPQLPDVNDKWIRNEIDQFVYEKLKEEKLKPSPEADKQTLLRRVSLDLIGVPAEEGIAKQFLNDNSEKAYENLVDKLLASPQYGEKWTSMWLDLAHYADTKGFDKDPRRNIPLGLLIGVFIVTVLYILSNVAYFMLLPAMGSTTGQTVIERGMSPPHFQPHSCGCWGCARCGRGRQSAGPQRDRPS
jgi:hypothetical protein